MSVAAAVRRFYTRYEYVRVPRTKSTYIVSPLALGGGGAAALVLRRQLLTNAETKW